MTTWNKLRILLFGNPLRVIPNNYFSGYRRIAMTADEITVQQCYTCRHAVAYHRWHCGLGYDAACEYERCYVKDELSPADYRAGLGRWLPLPPEEK